MINFDAVDFSECCSKEEFFWLSSEARWTVVYDSLTSQYQTIRQFYSKKIQHTFQSVGLRQIIPAIDIFQATCVLIAYSHPLKDVFKLHISNILGMQKPHIQVMSFMSTIRRRWAWYWWQGWLRNLAAGQIGHTASWEIRVEDLVISESSLVICVFAQADGIMIRTSQETVASLIRNITRWYLRIVHICPRASNCFCWCYCSYALNKMQLWCDVWGLKFYK